MSDERMTAAELQVVIDYLGLDQRALSKIIDVDERTVRRWVLGQSPVPEGVRLEVEQLEETTARAVEDVVEALHDARDPGVVVYRSDADLHRARPDAAHLPARWWRMVVARAVEQVPGVVIDYPPPAP